MSREVWWCEKHEWPALMRTYCGRGSECRMVRMVLTTPDSLIVEKNENGEWPKSATRMLARSLVEGVTPYDLLDALSLKEGGVPLSEPRPTTKDVTDAALERLGADVPVSTDKADLLLQRIVEKATPYGEQEGGFIAYYIIPTGPIHRAILHLQQQGFDVPNPPRPGVES